jgi:spermidine synthase
LFVFLYFFNLKETKFRTPIHQLSEAECEKMQLRYYSSEMHSAAFVVPRFARKALISLPKANEKETH